MPRRTRQRTDYALSNSAASGLGETLNSTDIKKFLIELSNRIVERKDELDSMDASCGDGDFGSTMASAFGSVAMLLEKTDYDDVGSMLAAVGSSITSSAGGASGPTVGALFSEPGKLAANKKDVGIEDLALMYEAADRKIRLMGKAGLGDKTVLDALVPAVNALKKARDSRVPLHTALVMAADASTTGCDSTRKMVAKHGKARYLGEQSLGFVDPGAYLVSLMFATLAATTKRL